MEKRYQPATSKPGKLTSEQQLQTRRIVIRNLESSAEFRLKVAGADPKRVSDYAIDFGMVRGVTLVTRIENGIVYAKIVETTEQSSKKTGRPRAHPSKLKYPFAGLEVGGSVLIDIPEDEHSRVRKSAWAWGKDRKQKLSCSVEGSAIRVTRTA